MSILSAGKFHLNIAISPDFFHAETFSTLSSRKKFLTVSSSIFARSNRKPLPDPSSYRQPGRHLGRGELMRSIKRGCPGVHSLFSRERARGSRTRVIAVQSARTLLNIWSAWNSVGYSLETSTKDLRVDQCKRDLSRLDGHHLVQCM